MPGTLGAFAPRLFPTLDEYSSPGLDAEILSTRNEDQVSIRYYQKKFERQRRPRQKFRLITVPQLWLWKIDDSVISFSQPVGKSTLDDLPRKFSLEEAIAFVLSEYVNLIDRPEMARLSEPIFSIFEKEIASLSESVNDYVQSTEVDDIDMVKEKEFLHNISDIREELSMIKNVLLQQEEVWKDYTYKAWPECWPNGENGRFIAPTDYDPTGVRHKMIELEIDPLSLSRREEGDLKAERQAMWRRIVRPQRQFSKFNRRVTQLDANAERIEKSIAARLDLEQKHTSIKEAHNTAIMSAAVFGFTVVTIIFTPLSFLVGLFALPIDQFQRNQIPSDGDSGTYPSNYVGKWIGKYAHFRESSSC